MFAHGALPTFREPVAANRLGGARGPLRWPFLVLVLAAAVSVAASACELEERPRDEPPRPVEDAPPLIPGGIPDVDVEPGEEPVVIEVDERLWAGAATVGAELVGEFVTREAMMATLDLGGTAVRFDDREWLLADILVSVDLSRPGDVAVWRVAGPSRVIEEYLARAREDVGERGPIQELGILPLDVRPCCERPEERARRW